MNKYLPRKNSIASFSLFLFEYFSHLWLTNRAARLLHRSMHMLRMHSDFMYSQVGFYFHCSEQEAILRYPIEYQHNLFPFSFLLFGVRTNFRAMIAYAPHPKIVASCIIFRSCIFCFCSDGICFSLSPSFSFSVDSHRAVGGVCALCKCNASPIGVKLECHTKTFAFACRMSMSSVLFDSLLLQSETCCKHPIVHPVRYLFPSRTFSLVGLTHRLMKLTGKQE